MGTLEIIIEKIHQFDNKKLSENFNLDLRNIVYLLELKNYIKSSYTIYDLSQKYNKKYYNIDPKKDRGDFALKMKDVIENNLKNLWYITNEYKPRLTSNGIKIINEIITEINWTFRNKINLKISKNPWITTLITISIAILSLIISFIALFKS